MNQKTDIRFLDVKQSGGPSLLQCDPPLDARFKGVSGPDAISMIPISVYMIGNHGG